MAFNFSPSKRRAMAEREQRMAGNQGQDLSADEIKAAVEGMDSLEIEGWCAQQWESNRFLRDGFPSLEHLTAWTKALNKGLIA